MSQKLKFPFMIHAVIYVQNAFKKKLRKNLLENNTMYYICISHVEYKKWKYHALAEIITKSLLNVR